MALAWESCVALAQTGFEEWPRLASRRQQGMETGKLLEAGSEEHQLKWSGYRGPGGAEISTVRRGTGTGRLQGMTSGMQHGMETVMLLEAGTERQHGAATEAQ